jgi:hypothetical protein
MSSLFCFREASCCVVWIVDCACAWAAREQRRFFRWLIDRTNFTTIAVLLSSCAGPPVVVSRNTPLSASVPTVEHS